MPASRPTEAAIARAIRAAQRAGAGVVEIDGHVIRIAVSGDVPQPANRNREAAECDQAFGTGAAS